MLFSCDYAVSSGNFFTLKRSVSEAAYVEASLNKAVVVSCLVSLQKAKRTFLAKTEIEE